MSRVRVGAVVLGFLAGAAGGVIWGMAMPLILGVPLTGENRASRVLGPEMPSYVALGLIGALGTSFLSGGVAALRAKGQEMPNAIAVGVFVVLLSVALFIPLELDKYPLWYNVPAFLGTIPLAALGGLVVSRCRRT